MVSRNVVGAWTGIAGLAGPVVWWVVIVVLGLLWPSYSAVSDFISTLAGVGAPYAPIQQLNFYLFGASILLLTLGVVVRSDRGWRLLLGVPFLVTFGVGVMVAGYYQYDPNNLEAATTRYHDAASMITFLAAIPAISLTSWGLHHDSNWPAYPSRFVPLGIAVLAIGGLATFIVSTGSGPDGWAGFGQRIFILVLTGWLAAHGFLLARLSRRERRSDADAIPG